MADDNNNEYFCRQKILVGIIIFIIAFIVFIIFL